MNADQFIGLTKKRAQDFAESKNMIFRLISIDGEPFFSYPEDVRQDRVCVEIVSSLVVKASIQ
jgi:hypothetical protein